MQRLEQWLLSRENFAFNAGRFILIFRRLPKPASFERIHSCIRSQWLLDARDNSAAIAFTSRLAGEGVSTIVVGLARAFGAADPGGVLVLDIACGPRRIADLLKMEAGLATIDAFDVEEFDLSSVVSRNEPLGFDLLRLTDAAHAGPAGAKRAPEMLTRLSASYRVILVDAGALTNSAGAYWLASSNYRVLVVDLTKATREVLGHQRKQLEHSGITLDGTILNKRSHPIPRSLYWLAR